MKKVSSVVGAAGIIAVLTLCSRFMGLVRKLAQSWAMSDGAVAGTYDTANTVPNVLFEVAAGGALAGAVIPLVSRFIARKLQTEESQTVSALITWILTVSVPLALLVVVCAEPIIGFLVGDAPDTQVALGASLLRMFALQIPLYGLSVVFSGVLQAHKLFVLPALAPLLSSIIVIGVFVWYALAVGPHVSPDEVTSQAVALLGWGTTAGVVIFSLVQLPSVIKLVNIRLTWRFKPGLGRETVRLGGAGLAALFAQQFALICVMYTTNALSDAGTFAAFNYAYAIFMVPYAVLAVPIATAVFPRISEACELGDNEKVQTLVCRSTYLVFVMGAVAAVLIATLSIPAKTVVELGNPIIGLDTALQSMALGAIGFSVLYHGARVFYALGQPQLVVLSNSIAWFTMVLLLVVGYALGIYGREMTLMWVGVSLSVGMTIGVVVIVVALRRASGATRILGDRGALGFTLGIVGVAGVVAWFVVPGVQEACGHGIGGAFVAACVGAVIVLGPVLVLLGKDIKQKVLS